MEVIRELVGDRRFYDYDTEVLTASVRHPRHVTEAALAGSHIATLPFKVFQQMVRHPLTDKGIVQFKRDWEAARAPPREREDRRARQGRARRDRPGRWPRQAAHAG